VKKKSVCKDHALSSSLQFKRFDVDEEVNNMMNGIPQDECNGYMCNIFYYSNSGGTVVEDYDVDVRNIDNGVVNIRNNVVDKCCKQSKT